MDTRIDALTVEQLERDIAAKDRDFQHLVEELRQAHAQLQQAKQAATRTESELGQALHLAQQSLQAAQAQLAAQSDYDDVKEDLRVLKAIEFGQRPTEGRSLEALLMEKTRALESENTALKVNLFIFINFYLEELPTI